MSIPKDKVIHFIGGACVTAFAAVMFMCLSSVGLTPLASALAVGGWAVGLSIEGSQYNDNRSLPGMHEVSFWDAFATALPGMIVAGVVQLVHLNLLP